MLHELGIVEEFRILRPTVLIHSDDWGLIGIRDRNGFDELREKGIPLGNHPYDYYSFETAEDLEKLYEVLLKHHDSIGRSPCLVFNFVLANVDFPEVIRSGFRRLQLLPLDKGLPGRWNRPGFLEAYKEGIKEGIVYPAYHGLSHFSLSAAKHFLQKDDQRGDLLRTLYISETPSLPSKTPCIGWEYGKGNGDGEFSWLSKSDQQSLIGEGKKIFYQLFGRLPVSACAPGYRANADTIRALATEGFRVMQNGPGYLLGPYFDRFGLLHLFRNVSLEPAIDSDRYDEYRALREAENAINSGIPAVVCIHSLNFHSTLKNYRDLTLERLDRFLTMLEQKYSNLLYISDEDLLDLILNGRYMWNGKSVSVPLRKRIRFSPQALYYLRRLKPLIPFR